MTLFLYLVDARASRGLRSAPRPVEMESLRVTNTRRGEVMLNNKPRSVTPPARHARGVEIYFVYRRRR